MNVCDKTTHRDIVSRIFLDTFSTFQFRVAQKGLQYKITSSVNTLKFTVVYESVVFPKNITLVLV